MSMSPLASSDVLERYLSSYGIVTFADHDNNGVADDYVVSDCQTYSIQFIMSKLVQRFTYAQVASCPMMIEFDAVITLRHLCVRRGNAPPASLEFRYQEIVQKDGMLDQIASGKMLLVDSNGLAIRSNIRNFPSHANLQIDRRFAEKQVRVTDSSSNMINTALPRFADINPNTDR